jgi:hypothetical protein
LNGLKDVADVSIAPGRQLALTQPRQLRPQHFNLAVGHAIDSRQQG